MEFEGLLATQQEMSFPDWSARLRRAQKESAQGNATTLEDLLRKRKSRSS